MKLLDEARQDFELFYANKARYQENVRRVANLLQLDGDAALRSDILPTYIVGDYADKRSKIVLLGMNPHFEEERNRKEEAYKSGTWEKYDNFIRTFFTFFKSNGIRSKYYLTLAHLFSGIEGRGLPADLGIYDYYQQNLINIDLVPYHSGSFHKPRLTHDAEKYMSERLHGMLGFVEETRPRMAIFNGGAYCDLLRNQGLLRGQQGKQIGKTTAYCFKYREIPCTAFSMMINSHWAALTTSHLENEIPRVIRESFGKFSNEEKKKVLLIKHPKP
jgi:hypothetical protein